MTDNKHICMGRLDKLACSIFVGLMVFSGVLHSAEPDTGKTPEKNMSLPDAGDTMRQI